MLDCFYQAEPCMERRIKGGSSGNGTVFKVNTDGTGFANLHSFTANVDGASPVAGLALSSEFLYGTTLYGGSSQNGTVFKVNTNGSSFTNLHSFAALVSGTNSDGDYAYGTLISSGNTLYGTAGGGGNLGKGTAFKVNSDGTDFTVLYAFNGGIDGASRAAVWSYWAASYMGRRGLAAVRAMARSSVSRRMARVLGPFMILQQPLALEPTVTDLDRMLVWFYMVIPFTERLGEAAVRAMARSSVLCCPRHHN